MERIINLIQKLNDKFEKKRLELISSPISCDDGKKDEYQKIVRGVEFALSSIPLDIDGDYLTAFNAVKNSIIKANLLNLQSKYLSVFYTKDIKYDFFFTKGLFPHQYKNENCDFVKLTFKEEYIDLKKCCTLSRPVLMHKWANVLMREEEFKYDRNHKTIYYSYSGIAIPYNGFHSITDGWLNRSNCIVKCLSTDEKDLFEHIFTDGSFWYNKVDGSIIEQVKDVQLAVHHYLVKLQANDFRKTEQ